MKAIEIEKKLEEAFEVNWKNKGSEFREAR